MGGSTRTFEYTLQPKNGDITRLLAQAERVLGWACDGDPAVTCHGVSGEALGIVTLNLTIRGRDQWWSRQLAQDVLNLVTWGLEANATQVQLESRRQEVHQHRGYRHGRTKRYREQGTTPRRSAASPVGEPTPPGP